MPDPLEAKRYIWAPFIEGLGLDASTVLVGHSSGAACAMRLAETHRLHGLVLVSAYHTTLGDSNEEVAGYFPPLGGAWQWDAIRRNTNGNVVVLNSSHCMETVRAYSPLPPNLGAYFMMSMWRLRPLPISIATLTCSRVRLE